MPSHRRSVRALCLVGVGTAVVGRAVAQCDERWVPGDGLVGLSGTVRATIRWDRDGPGPEPALLIVGGDFAVAGDVLADSLAAWDGERWIALGSPIVNGSFRGAVWALAVTPSNDLMVGGSFTSIGGVAAANIARLTPEGGWMPVGVGLGPPTGVGSVRSITPLADGRLFIGGTFAALGDGTPAARVAMWDGAAMTAMGSGLAVGVYATAALPSGELVAGGGFTSPSQGVARWNGTAWVSMGGVSGTINALLVRSGGELVATGSFTSPALHIARWNGTAWRSLGPDVGTSGIAGTGHALAEDESGNLVVGGNFFVPGGGSINCSVASWSGSAWTRLARIPNGPNNSVFALTAGSGSGLVAGGDFLTINDVTAGRVASLSGGAWSGLGDGFNERIWAVLPLPGGDVVVGGRFTRAGGAAANFIARRSGGVWHALGEGVNAEVFALAARPNGDIVAGGLFTEAGGAEALRVARWDGVQWHAMGGGVDNNVRALLALPNGDVIAGGAFGLAGGSPASRVARWDGAAWTAMGGGITGGSFSTYFVYALARLPSGDVVAGGDFNRVEGFDCSLAARWDGSAWASLTPPASGLGGGSDPWVSALAVAPDGRLLAGGTFTTAGGANARVAAWDGAAWSPVGIGTSTPSTGSIAGLAAAADGTIVAGGSFTQFGGAAAANVARFRDGAWAVLGTGVAGTVNAAAFASNGDTLVGGSFTIVGGVVSASLAAWSSRPGCAADFNCSGGAPTLQDLFDYLTAYFGGLPAADFNGDGGATVQDVFDYLSAYFGGCG